LETLAGLSPPHHERRTSAWYQHPTSIYDSRFTIYEPKPGVAQKTGSQPLNSSSMIFCRKPLILPTFASFCQLLPTKKRFYGGQLEIRNPKPRNPKEGRNPKSEPERAERRPRKGNPSESRLTNPSADCSGRVGLMTRAFHQK
jgi:hypothetical protein